MDSRIVENIMAKWMDTENIDEIDAVCIRCALKEAYMVGAVDGSMDSEVAKTAHEFFESNNLEKEIL